VPTYVITDQAQLAMKGGGGWKRQKFVTVTGDATTYSNTANANGWAITTANVGMPISILGLQLIATSGSLAITDVTYDYTNSSMRMFSSGVELGAGNSTAFTTAQVLKIVVYGV
jgi:hypothetical protein